MGGVTGGVEESGGVSGRGIMGRMGTYLFLQPTWRNDGMCE